MKYLWSRLLCLLALLLWSCNPKEEIAQIKGRIPHPIEAPLIIDGKTVAVSPEGEFSYERATERPQLLDLAYGNLEWTLFLMPHSRIDLFIPDQSLELIKYGGDHQTSNAYLLTTLTIGEEIDWFFNENWMRMHSLDQVAYIATIDSLKNLYFEHTNEADRAKTLSNEFVDVWRAEINYAFNALILRYPERYLQFPPAPIKLTDETWDYLIPTKVDRLNYMALPGYKSYTRAWIELKADRLTQGESSQRHYDLRKMGHIFSTITESFENQELVDRWKSEFLKGHIEKQGYANAQPYLDQFYASVQTPSYKEEIDETIRSIKDAREDHQVKIYKSVDGFNLEAHVFQTQTPPNEKNPAIVIFHGGGWNSGNPSWGFGRAKHFADHGMVAVAAQYRLTNEHDITAVESMDDARDLVIWMRQNADSLHLDPERITGYGWSAGAHLISSAAIFPETDSESHVSSVPNALALVSPAVSLPKGEGWKYWNFNVLGTKARVEEVNPVEHVRRGLPPTIIVQGREDTVTPLEGVQSFKDEMQTHGNTCELFIYDGVGHLFTPSSMPDNGWPKPDQEIQKQAFDQVDDFLKRLGFMAIQ